MKKISSFLGICLVSVALSAQNTYDVMRLSESDVTGTAKYVGMGGAMNALGADISVISSNPAGIGVYRSADAAFSLSLNGTKNSGTFSGVTTESDKFSASVSNLGLVFASNVDNGSLKFVNIAFNYRRSNSFANNFEIAGSIYDGDNIFSQQYALRDYHKISGPYIDWNNYYSLDYPWLGLMASQGGLVNSDNNLLYAPHDGNKAFTGFTPDKMFYRSNEKGGVDDIDVNISCNIDDRLYLGATFTASNVDYTRYSEYLEYSDDYDFYTIENRYNVSGNGFAVKLGAILRPFENSPLRFGAAIHTPTWYSLTDCASAAIIGDDGSLYDTRDYEAYGEELYVDYDVVTPWRFNLSAAYTFGSFAALDAEYEYVDYTGTKIKYAEGDDIDELNGDIKANMKGQHIFRVGALFNLDSNFSLRCGYNHITAAYKKDACKLMTMYHDTSTEYSNKYAMDIMTFGAGYQSDSFYFDLAYKLGMQKSDFYNYYDLDFVNPAAEVETERHSLVMTLGCRF